MVQSDRATYTVGLIILSKIPAEAAFAFSPSGFDTIDRLLGREHNSAGNDYIPCSQS